MRRPLLLLAEPVVRSQGPRRHRRHVCRVARSACRSFVPTRLPAACSGSFGSPAHSCLRGCWLALLACLFWFVCRLGWSCLLVDRLFWLVCRLGWSCLLADRRFRLVRRLARPARPPPPVPAPLSAGSSYSPAVCLFPVAFRPDLSALQPTARSGPSPLARPAGPPTARSSSPTCYLFRPTDCHFALARRHPPRCLRATAGRSDPCTPRQAAFPHLPIWRLSGYPAIRQSRNPAIPPDLVKRPPHSGPALVPAARPPPHSAL